MKPFIIRVLASLASVAWTSSAMADEDPTRYPSRPAKIVVGFAAGGLPDVVARLIAQRFSEQLPQQFVVENRPGAGGIVAADYVAKSPGDGYTLLVADVGQWAINPAIYSKLPYDPLKNFAPVSRIGTTPLFLVMRAQVPANSLGDLQAVAKSTKGGMNYGSSGIGSIHHLVFETLKLQTGMPLTHVPYKGSGQVVPALLGGEVSLMLAALPTVAAHVRSGQVKLLAIAAGKRAAAAPDVPTFSELGIPGLDFPVDIGLLAPAGTPRAIVDKLAAQVRVAVHHRETVERFAAWGLEPIADSPDSYLSTMRADIEKYARAVKVSGAKVD